MPSSPNWYTLSSKLLSRVKKYNNQIELPKYSTDGLDPMPLLKLYKAMYHFKPYGPDYNYAKLAWFLHSGRYTDRRWAKFKTEILKKYEEVLKNQVCKV